MPSRKPHTVKSVFISFKEDELNAILAMLTPKLNEIHKNPKTRGYRKKVQLFSTIQNTFRKALKGLAAVRKTGSPIASMDDWERVAAAMKTVYQQGKQAGSPDEDYLRVSETVQGWVDNHKYNPSDPEEQVARIQFRNNVSKKTVSLASFPVDEILPLIQMVDKKNSHKVELAGRMVNVCSLRLQTFKTHGVKCTTCGLKGEYFSLEYHKGDNHGNEHPHLNLYGVEDDTPVLMTHDHTNPLSNGGSNDLKNTQTMCSPCNQVKGSRHVK